MGRASQQGNALHINARPAQASRPLCTDAELDGLQNKLEKKPLMRGDPGRAADQESGGDASEGAKQAVQGATEKAKDALEGAKKAVSGSE